MKPIDQGIIDFICNNYSYGDKEYVLGEMYKDYVDKTGDKVGRIKFTRLLRRAFPEIKQKQQRLNGKHTRTIYGLQYKG